jgi:hypothetical protein
MAKAIFTEAANDDLLFEVEIPRDELLLFFWQPHDFLGNLGITLHDHFTMVFHDRVGNQGNFTNSTGRSVSEDVYIVNGIDKQGLLVLEGVRVDKKAPTTLKLPTTKVAVRRTKESDHEGAIHGEFGNTLVAAKFMEALIVNQAKVESLLSNAQKTFEVKPSRDEHAVPDNVQRCSEVKMTSAPILFYEGEKDQKAPCWLVRFHQPDPQQAMEIGVIGAKKND